MTDRHLRRTELLGFDAPAIRDLIAARGWADLLPFERIGAAYDLVRDEVAFGYNRDDAIPASRVLADGRGQCNTKATLLMALLRELGVPCRLHGFTIRKALQRGVVPDVAHAMAPERILHSWVEVAHEGAWIRLEGFILDAPFLGALRSAFPGRTSLCAYGAGTDRLPAPPVVWTGGDTFIQAMGIADDLGLWDDADAFHAVHRQCLGLVRGALYRHAIRRWMNARVAGIRRGRVPAIPGMEPPQRGATAPAPRRGPAGA